MFLRGCVQRCWCGLLEGWFSECGNIEKHYRLHWQKTKKMIKIMKLKSIYTGFYVLILFVFCNQARQDDSPTTELVNDFSEVCISRSKILNGQYTDFEKINPPVSIGKNDMYPYIAPDERLLIFSSDRSGKDTFHLFMTVPDGMGGWKQPVQIETGPDINVQPFLTFDKKYLFFTSKGDIYWMSAKIIKDFKSKQ